MTLETLWVHVCAGSARIVNHGSSPQTFELEVEVDQSIRREGEPLESRLSAILQALLLGTSPMIVALECGISASTVTVAASRALERCGARSGISSVPLVLAAAAHAAAGVAALRQDVETNSAADHRRRVTFLLPRVELQVRDRS